MFQTELAFSVGPRGEGIAKVRMALFRTHSRRAGLAGAGDKFAVELALPWARGKGQGADDAIAFFDAPRWPLSDAEPLCAGAQRAILIALTIVAAIVPELAVQWANRLRCNLEALGLLVGEAELSGHANTLSILADVRVASIEPAAASLGAVGNQAW
mmetsp:Transcript_4704/g.14205  ORF Transcript_4704/g.14205 Transcript_4704/m.14205 type:complete len:157 (-) Transcript_4704:601-1071(-)